MHVSIIAWGVNNLLDTVASHNECRRVRRWQVASTAKQGICKPVCAPSVLDLNLCFLPVTLGAKLGTKHNGILSP